FAATGRRRTQVILYLLREAGLVCRGRRGYILKSADPISEDRIAELLSDYTDRAARDKDRLAEMMHYAQTTTCRTQVLRTYFGESAGDPCRRCDNCERGLNADADLIQPRRRRSRTAVPATQLEPATTASNPTIDAHGATVIESIHGEIHTTAPETLPHADQAKFAIGDRVRHKSFGLGRVRDLLGTAALVHFPRAGDKRVHTDFLSPAA
ncbi:MAG TPA: RecQ family zinc-binding domain-containing protein, partial [Acidobacteriaceae bacterium]|nr:RecQ family zinc-binding domain-containing protein [Acidobacteriaceae bacterium]